MTLTQLNYIITVADTQSMNKAAEVLYVSQPSLTNGIKELEKELGITFLAGAATVFFHDIFILTVNLLRI